MFEYKITAKKDKARRGVFATPHGSINTPVFMPVGTVGAVKGVAPWELESLDAEIILANTYHLMLRPGEGIIKKAGGLHAWEKWNKPMLTDSGGYQVFSLGGRFSSRQSEDRDSCRSLSRVSPRDRNDKGKNRLSSHQLKEGDPCLRRDDNINSRNDNGRDGDDRVGNREEGSQPKIKPAKITDRGVEFYSHIDGKKHFLDAEKSIKIQQELGADIIMAFDECPPGDASIDYIKKAVDRTHDWLNQSIRAWTNRESQALFGIVQGATNRELRELSAKYVNSKDLPGNAIGGVSVGESRENVWKAVEWSVPHLDENKPRYLMGIGEPADIIEAVKRGCDMFDCVLPTRLARHGVVWVRGGGVALKKAMMPDGKIFAYQNLDLRKGKYINDQDPIDKNCKCPTCSAGFSVGYIHHLIKEKEMLGVRLTTIHNLHFIFNLIKDLRMSIG